MKPATFRGSVMAGFLFWLTGAVLIGVLVSLLLLPVARALSLLLS